MAWARLGRIFGRAPRTVELSVRTPSLGVDAGLRVAVSRALAEAAGWDGGGPMPGLLSGDGLQLPEVLDGPTARAVLDALAADAPTAFASEAALLAAAQVAFDAYVAARADHREAADIATSAIQQACAVSLDGDGGRSDLERFTASGLGFADWQALQTAPLRDALTWLGARAVHHAIEAER